MRTQLYLIQGGVWRDEPLNVATNAPDNHGIEAWCRLTNLWQQAEFVDCCGELLVPLRPRNKRFIQPLEKWETQVTKYGSQSKDVVRDHIHGTTSVAHLSSVERWTVGDVPGGTKHSG